MVDTIDEKELRKRHRVKLLNMMKIPMGTKKTSQEIKTIERPKGL
jgi:hypothetical protein